MDIDPEPMGTNTQMQQKAEEEGTIDTEEVEEEDESEDTVDVAMTPMADILNARNGSDNVRLTFLTRNSY